MSILKKKSYVISVAGQYRYQSVSFDDVELQDVGMPTPSHYGNEGLHGFSTGISVAANGKLFGKDMVYVGGIVADGGHGFETVTAMLVATMIQRKTENTTMSLGLYGSTSKSAIFPFFPVFAYTHRFSNGWTFDSVFPARAHFRRAVGQNGRFSGGYTMDSNTFYIYPRDKENFPHNYTYNRVDARFELGYEHFLNKNILLNVKGGFNQCYEGVMRQKYKTKDIVTLNQNGNFFVNMGIAYKL